MYRIGIKVDCNMAGASQVIDSNYGDQEFETIEEAQEALIKLSENSEVQDEVWQAAIDALEPSGWLIVCDEDGEEVDE